MEPEQQQIEEVRRVVRVSSKGEKTRRIKCRKGFKRQGNTCVPITGSEKASKKRSIKKAVRTRKAKPSIQKRATKKRLRAMKKRKGYGL